MIYFDYDNDSASTQSSAPLMSTPTPTPTSAAATSLPPTPLHDLMDIPCGQPSPASMMSDTLIEDTGLASTIAAEEDMLMDLLNGHATHADWRDKAQQQAHGDEEN